MHPPTETYTGVDLHSNRFNFCRLGDGSPKRATYELCDLEAFIKTLTPGEKVCLEASTPAFAFARRLRPYVREVKIIHPLYFQAIYMSGKKTDKIDAQALAHALAYAVKTTDPSHKLPEVFIPEEWVSQLRCLFKTYESLKRQTTSFKNRVHSIMRENLIKYEGRDIAGAEDFAREQGLQPVYLMQIEMLLKQINSLEQCARELGDQAIEICSQQALEEMKILLSIKGISPLIAAALLADIGTIHRFRGAKNLASYLRSTPGVRASNEAIHLGKINKQGRKLSFSLLLQAVPHAMKENEALKGYYERKTKAKSKGKVRGALVRKLIVTVFYMLKNRELNRFRDQPAYEKKLYRLDKRLSSSAA